jgi:hypothetical protein
MLHTLRHCARLAASRQLLVENNDDDAAVEMQPRLRDCVRVTLRNSPHFARSCKMRALDLGHELLKASGSSRVIFPRLATDGALTCPPCLGEPVEEGSRPGVVRGGTLATGSATIAAAAAIMIRDRVVRLLATA